MPYRVQQNVILDGVVYEKDDVLDLSFLKDENVRSLEERGVVKQTNDEATKEHGHVVDAASPVVNASSQPAYFPEEVPAPQVADNGEIAGQDDPELTEEERMRRDAEELGGGQPGQPAQTQQPNNPQLS